MTEILATAVQFLEQQDWPFVRIEEQPILQVVFHSENALWDCYVVAEEERQQFTFYSVAPTQVPEEKRIVTAEFITRVNYGLAIGNFELDFEDGEIRFKTSINVEGDLSTALVERMVVTNVAMMDEYLPGIMKVIYGDISPKKAIAEIEEVGEATEYETES